MLKYLILVLVGLLAVGFRLAVAGPFGAQAAKSGLLPQSWKRWIFDEPSPKKSV